MMHIGFGKELAHSEQLRRGLEKLGPSFVATICWWCEGTGTREHFQCRVCGYGKPYGTSLGLLVFDKPAPESVVNQVLVAGEEVLPLAT